MTTKEVQAIFYQLLDRNANEWFTAFFSWQLTDARKASKCDAQLKKVRAYAALIKLMNEDDFTRWVRSHAAEYIRAYNELASYYPEIVSK